MWSTSSIKALFIKAGHASKQAPLLPMYLSVSFCESNFPNLTYLECTTKAEWSQNKCCIGNFRDLKLFCDATMHVSSRTYKASRSSPNRFSDLHLNRSGSHCRRAESFIVSLSLVCLSPVKAAFLAPFGPNCLLFAAFDAEDPKSRHRMFNVPKYVNVPVEISYAASYLSWESAVLLLQVAP